MRSLRRAGACATGALLAVVAAATPAWAVAPAAPPAPTVMGGNGQIVVTYIEPADNGSQITSYTATCSTSAMGGATGTGNYVTSNESASPITVTGLTNGDSYTCTVFATTDSAGPASPPSGSVIAGAPAPPAQPTASVGNAQLVVTYGEPADNGRAITSYSATCSTTAPGGATATGIYPTSDESASPITVTGLTDGDPYTCSVVATSSVGNSPASPPSTAATPIGPPAQLAQPTASVGNAQLVVTYGEPADNGRAITSYAASCSTTAPGGANGTGTYVTPNESASPITVVGLTDGDAYTCTVTATNVVGTSPASSPSASATPVAAIPSTPAQPTVTSGNLALVVTYVAPANNGSQIISYGAVCTSTNGGALGSGTYVTPDGTVQPIMVGSVTMGKSYTCHVRATNGVGSSADSPESSPAVVVAAVPGAPSVPSLVSGNGQVVVSFVAGVANGAAVTGNTATCTSTDGGAAGSAGGVSPITVSGLTNGANYNCSVVTTNGIGSGPSSTNSIVVGLPAVVAQPMVVSGDTQVFVGFVLPSLDGSALVAYNATCLSAGNPVAFGSGLGSPVVVSGAVDGQSYTCHVNAENTVGVGPDSPQSVVVVPAGVPGFSPAPTITPLNNVMEVAFVAPVANGAPIMSYLVTCSSSDGGVSATKSGPGSPIDVPGLSNGNSYTCDVSATNSAGTGSVSDESASAVANAVPGAPAQPTVVGGPSRVVVSFGLPAANGNTIVSTTATCTSSNGGVSGTAVSEPQDVGETFSPITVTRLTNGKSYTCKVSATNGVGTGPLSPVSAATIPRTPPGVPSAVKALSGNAVGAAGPVIVSFTAGAANGSPITSFRATCTDEKDGLTFTKTGVSSPLTLGGLTTGHPFSCVVLAVSAGGTSGRSTAVTVTLGAPGQPTIARVVQSHHGVTLTVLAPIANGAPVTRYIARCTSTNGGIGRGSASSGGQLVVTNMSLGATYNCSVTAYNSRGPGTPTKTGPINITK